MAPCTAAGCCWLPASPATSSASSLTLRVGCARWRRRPAAAATAAAACNIGAPRKQVSRFAVSSALLSWQQCLLHSSLHWPPNATYPLCHTPRLLEVVASLLSTVVAVVLGYHTLSRHWLSSSMSLSPSAGSQCTAANLAAFSFLPHTVSAKCGQRCGWCRFHYLSLFFFSFAIACCHPHASARNKSAADNE